MSKSVWQGVYLSINIFISLFPAGYLSPCPTRDQRMCCRWTLAVGRTASFHSNVLFCISWPPKCSDGLKMVVACVSQSGGCEQTGFLCREKTRLIIYPPSMSLRQSWLFLHLCLAGTDLSLPRVSVMDGSYFRARLCCDATSEEGQPLSLWLNSLSWWIFALTRGLLATVVHKYISDCGHNDIYVCVCVCVMQLWGCSMHVSEIPSGPDVQ